MEKINYNSSILINDTENMYPCKRFLCKATISNVDDFVEFAALSDTICGFKKDIKLLHEIFWSTKSLNTLCILDTSSIKSIIESKSRFQSSKLWDMIAYNASDNIEMGGWINSYTREKFTELEMQEFKENAINKISKHINKEMTILEIGCASGYIMYDIVPHVKKYIGIDFSSEIIKKNLVKKEKNKIKNLELYCASADMVDNLGFQNIDLVIINSVAQLFDGYCYFYRLLDKIISIMNPHGTIFIGDVMDLNKKNLLLKELIEFKEKNPYCNTKIELNNELFYSKEFFRDLIFDYPIKTIEFSDKVGTIKNELTKYRYDVLLHLGNSDDLHPNLQRKKFQFALG